MSMYLHQYQWLKVKFPIYSFNPARSRLSQSGIFGNDISLNSLDEKNTGPAGNGSGELPGGFDHNLGELAIITPLGRCCSNLLRE